MAEQDKLQEETCVVPVSFVRLACKALDQTRCRDCANYEIESRHCEAWGIYTEQYGYCYRAERKENNDL